LSDESGKITREDVIRLGLLAMGVMPFIAPIHEVSAHGNVWHIIDNPQANPPYPAVAIPPL
jgi:hypothetical protein